MILKYAEKMLMSVAYLPYNNTHWLSVCFAFERPISYVG